MCLSKMLFLDNALYPLWYAVSSRIEMITLAILSTAILSSILGKEQEIPVWQFHIHTHKAVSLRIAFFLSKFQFVEQTNAVPGENDEKQ